MTLQSSTSLAPSTTEPGHTSPLASRDSPVVQHRKSRIPRFLTPPPKPNPKPYPKPSPKPTTLAPKPPPASLKLVKPPVQTFKLYPKTDVMSTPALRLQRVELAPRSVQTMPAPVVRQDAKPTPPKATSDLKPVMSSTPAKATGRKDTTRPERLTRVLSDARKVKRMITGVAPLDAAVDCSAAPEWKEGSPPANSTCVPRPHNLHITRRVGVDGVVIAWDPLEHDCVAGFQVLLGGRVVQHVRSAHRTKALVTALPLAGSFTVGLVAVAGDGRCSTPALVTQDRSRVYPGRTVALKPHRRAIPTAL